MAQTQTFNTQTYLRAQVSCKAWTAADLELLHEAHARMGSNWKLIAEQYFPDRNANQLKCKFNYITARQHQPKAA